MPCFTIYTFMHQDKIRILGHNDFLVHRSTAIIIITITIIIVILPYVNSTQLQQVTQQHETNTVFTPVQDDSNLRQPSK